MNKSSTIRILIAVIIFTLLFEYLTNAAIIKSSQQIDNSHKIGDSGKRHVGKEKLKIYRIIAEHIGPSEPSAKEPSDVQKYDSIEFEEKKISAIQEVVTSSLDAKYTRNTAELANPHHSNERDVSPLNTSKPYDKLLTGLKSKSYQSKKSLNLLEITGQNRLNELNPLVLNSRSYEKYKLPSSKQSMEPIAKASFENSDQDYDDEFISDYDEADTKIKDSKNLDKIANQKQVSTKVYKNEFTKSYGIANSENYMPTKVYQVRDNIKHSSFQKTKEEKTNQDLKATTYSNLSLKAFEQFISKDSLKMNEGGFDALNNSSLNPQLKTEIDAKTDASVRNVNLKHQPGEGSKISLKVERKSLQTPFPNMLQPEPKVNDNPAPGKSGHKNGDVNLAVVRKPFEHAEGENGIFYVGEEAKRSDDRDPTLLQILKSNATAVLFIMILNVIIVILLLYAVCSIVKRGRSSDNNQLNRPDPDGGKSKFNRLWKEGKIGPFNVFYLTNVFRKTSPACNKDSKDSYVSEKGKIKKINDAIGSKWEEVKNKINTSRNQKSSDSRGLQAAYPEVSVSKIDVTLLRKILNQKLKYAGKTRKTLIDSETDSEPSPKQQLNRRCIKKRKSNLKRFNFHPPYSDLESINSYEADQSTDDESPWPSFQPDYENLRMKLLSTDEIKEIDEMLPLENDQSRRGGSLHPCKATGKKAVNFSAVEDPMVKTGKDTSPLSAATKESTRSLEKELGRSLLKAENVIRKGKPLSKKEISMKHY